MNIRLKILLAFAVPTVVMLIVGVVLELVRSLGGGIERDLREDGT